MKQPYRGLFSVLLVLLPLGACSVQPVQTAQAEPVTSYYVSQPQETAFTRQTLVLNDASRGKKLPVTVLYPNTNRAHPVVVFSHGFRGTGAVERPLAEYWAAHGYFVVLPTHADSQIFGPPAPADRVTSGLAWKNRAADVSFIITSLGRVAKRLEGYRGRPDVNRLAVAGHSFGSYTALLTAGLVVDTPAGLAGASFSDPRPRAFIALSPQGRGSWTGLRKGSWNKLNRPVLFASGSLDISEFDHKPPSWRLEAYKASPPGNKFQLYLRGADHEDMSGRELKTGAEATLRYASLRSVSLAFLDSYLRGSPRAKRYLSSNRLEKVTGGVAHLEAK